MCQKAIRTVLASLVLSAVAFGQCGEEKPKEQPSAEVAPHPSGGKGGKAGVFADEKIDIGRLERHYRLVVPNSVDLEKPVPLMFAFHGALVDSKELMPAYSQLDALAQREKFILVYPNASNKVGWVIVRKLARNDLEFFDGMLKRIGEQYNIDLNRVYCTGMSNGGYFCHLLAAERSKAIAAIAAHSAGIEGLGGKVGGERKVPVFIVHGADDPVIKVESARMARDAYQKAGHEVEYWEIEKHGHSWALMRGVNGKIWEFFAKHPRPEPEDLKAGSGK